MDNPESRRIGARDHLADVVEDAWFETTTDRSTHVAGQIRALQPSDPNLDSLATSLAPFLDNDERIEGLLYPGGEASYFLDSHDGEGSDSVVAAFIVGPVRSIGIDHERWAEHITDQSHRCLLGNR